MMCRMGFYDRFMERVMFCVTNVWYFVWHNGNYFSPIVLGHGLRQGDPSSPYLFIICVEGLSALLKEKEGLGLIHGCCVAKRKPFIMHLFFSNDSLLFFKATNGECQVIKGVLQEYE